MLGAVIASDYEHDEDGICGWEAEDFDDHLLDRGQRKAVSKTLSSKDTKRSPEKKNKAGSVLPALHKQKQQSAESLPEKQSQVADIYPENQNEPPVYRKLKRKQPHKVRELHHHQILKPSPRTTSIQEENAAIAAFGRQRRMRVVAAAMAAKIPRKPGIASVVSAAFDDESDDDPEEKEKGQKRRPDECMPFSAPHNQPLKLPRIAEPSTAPARPIHPRVPLPLLSINPNSGGKETRVAGRDEPPPQSLRHKWRHKQQKNSLLPSRDVCENWESNFPPSQRRLSSSSKCDTSSSDASTSGEPTAFTRAARAPVAPKQIRDNSTSRTKELPPCIHQVSKEMDSTASSATCSGGSCSGGGKQSSKIRLREEKDSVGDDDESWALGYDDPDVIMKSMAGLIQALSTFAAGGKDSKHPRGGKGKKRRAKSQQQQTQLLQQHILLQHPQLRRHPLGENYDTSSKVYNNERPQEPDRISRRRKHRKVQ